MSSQSNGSIDFREELKDSLMMSSKTDCEHFFDWQLVDYSKDVVIPNKRYIPPLFRYVPADYNSIRSLETRSLYLSEIGEMNDVFEGIAGDTSDKELAYFKNLSDMAYIKSFSENPNDLVMWGIYADNYKGMCIEYDFSQSDETLLYHLFPVIYSDKRRVRGDYKWLHSFMIEYKAGLEKDGFVDYANSDDARDIMALFLMKSDAWKHEREWRIVVTYLQLHAWPKDVCEEESEYSLYNISRNINNIKVKSVKLGPRMSDSIKEHIKDIGQKIGFEVSEMSLDSKEYKLIVKK